MHRRCIGHVGDATTASAWGDTGSTSSRIGDASAMRCEPLTPSARTPSKSPRIRSGVSYRGTVEER
eukprot:1969647-Pyramimonas_sp.AAC.1